MLDELGEQGWWPARTRFEVILGAILTQNTAWHNAALAISSLRKAGLLTSARLREAPLEKIANVIRCAGFFRQKARAIRNFIDWLGSAHGGSLNLLFATEASTLRRQLLALKGLGPETADAILLYAGKQPFFVADAYTRRILARHGHIPRDAGYSEVQHFLHRHLPPDSALFNEYHALIMEVGKRYCRPRDPRCDVCPLRELLPQRRSVAAVE
jgi:endonuclease-3 related protein